MPFVGRNNLVLSNFGKIEVGVVTKVVAVLVLLPMCSELRISLWSESQV